MAAPQPWPTQKQHVDYYARFCRRLEQIASLSQSAVLNRGNIEYMRQAIRFIRMASESLALEVLRYEPVRNREVAERNEAARLAGQDNERPLRTAYWINTLLGFRNNSKQSPGLIAELTERINELFDEKKIAEIKSTSYLLETSLGIIREDANYILAMFAKYPQPENIPPVHDSLVQKIEEFLNRPQPTETTAEARDRKKKFPPKKPKHAPRIKSGGKGEAATKGNE